MYCGQGWQNLSYSSVFDDIIPVLSRLWYFRKKRVPPQVMLSNVFTPHLCEPIIGSPVLLERVITRKVPEVNQTNQTKPPNPFSTELQMSISGHQCPAEAWGLCPLHPCQPWLLALAQTKCQGLLELPRGSSAAAISKLQGPSSSSSQPEKDQNIRLLPLFES